MRAAAIVELPSGMQIGANLELAVRQVQSDLYGADLALSVGGEICDQWTASSDPHRWSGAIGETDPQEILVLAPATELILWSGTVRIYDGIEFDRKSSQPVTAADGSLEAELAFPGSTSGNRKSIEAALSAAGFNLRRWADDTLRCSGQRIHDGLTPGVHFRKHAQPRSPDPNAA